MSKLQSDRLSTAKILVGVLLAASAALALAAEPAHEQRKIDQPFDALMIQGDVDVELVQGPVVLVAVDAPAPLMSSIRTSVEHGALRIDSSSMHLLQFASSHGAKMLVTVTTPNLRQISVDGASDLHATSFSSTGELALLLRGSGDVNIAQINVSKLTTEIAGSADVDIAGSASEQSVKIAGSGDYRAENLKSASAAVSIAGSGDVLIWVSTNLAIQIAGSGDVGYWGNPTVSQSVVGSGEVSHRAGKG